MVTEANAPPASAKNNIGRDTTALDTIAGMNQPPRAVFVNLDRPDIGPKQRSFEPQRSGVNGFLTNKCQQMVVLVHGVDLVDQSRDE